MPVEKMNECDNVKVNQKDCTQSSASTPASEHSGSGASISSELTDNSTLEAPVNISKLTSVQQDSSVPKVGLTESSIPTSVQQDSSVPKVGLSESSIPTSVQQDSSVPKVGLTESSIPTSVQQDSSVPKVGLSESFVSTSQSVGSSASVTESVESSLLTPKTDVQEHSIATTERAPSSVLTSEQVTKSLVGNDVALDSSESQKSIVDDITMAETSGDDMDVSSPSLRAPSPEGYSLRHRIDPEPPRDDSRDGDDDFLTQHSQTKTLRDKRKVAEIRQVLAAQPVDVNALKKLAISPGGLVNKAMRQEVWPFLVGANTTNITPKPSQEEMEALSETYKQVVLDVNRSSSRFPPGINEHVRMSMKDKLVDLIMRVMLKHQDLHYYQGFHDVCITFLLCMDEDLAFAMVERLTQVLMREYLDKTMERTSMSLNFILPILKRCNPELYQHLQDHSLGTLFALSWVITWFSHVLGDIRYILRVFDFFLASHRLMPIYLSVAFVLYREQDIYEAGDEMGYIHKCLLTIPENLPLESLLERAGDLYVQYPPAEIFNDPLLEELNREVYAQFNRINSRAMRRRVQEQNDARSRLFVRFTMWTVTAVMGVAIAVLYHNYSNPDGSSYWQLLHEWSPFS